MLLLFLTNIKHMFQLHNVILQILTVVSVICTNQHSLNNRSTQ